jgi:hypothetical protein
VYVIWQTSSHVLPPAKRYPFEPLRQSVVT